MRRQRSMSLPTMASSSSKPPSSSNTARGTSMQAPVTAVTSRATGASPGRARASGSMPWKRCTAPPPWPTRKTPACWMDAVGIAQAAAPRRPLAGVAPAAPACGQPGGVGRLHVVVEEEQQLAVWHARRRRCSSLRPVERLVSLQHGHSPARAGRRCHRGAAAAVVQEDDLQVRVVRPLRVSDRQACVTSSARPVVGMMSDTSGCRASGQVDVADGAVLADMDRVDAGRVPSCTSTAWTATSSVGLLRGPRSCQPDATTAPPAHGRSAGDRGRARSRSS